MALPGVGSPNRNIRKQLVVGGIDDGGRVGELLGGVDTVMMADGDVRVEGRTRCLAGSGWTGGGGGQQCSETKSSDRVNDLHVPHERVLARAGVMVDAVFDGKPINYCPYNLVDNDAAMARGLAQGYPKKSVLSSRLGRSLRRVLPLRRSQPGFASAAAFRPMVSGLLRRGLSWRRRLPTRPPSSIGRASCAAISRD